MCSHKVPQIKKYWYEFFHEECPVCGCLSDWKERRYTEKPEEAKERHHYSQQCDYCQY